MDKTTQCCDDRGLPPGGRRDVLRAPMKRPVLPASPHSPLFRCTDTAAASLPRVPLRCELGEASELRPCARLERGAEEFGSVRPETRPAARVGGAAIAPLPFDRARLRAIVVPAAMRSRKDPVLATMVIRAKRRRNSFGDAR